MQETMLPPWIIERIKEEEKRKEERERIQPTIEGDLPQNEGDDSEKKPSWHDEENGERGYHEEQIL